MEIKVTNFEISKRLHELGYDSESHCGWWVEVLGVTTCWESNIEEAYIEKIIWQKRKPGINREDIEDYYKAYDCWDCMVYLISRGYDTFKIRGRPEKVTDELALMIIKDLEK